jgi:hypothetical protein
MNKYFLLFLLFNNSSFCSISEVGKSITVLLILKTKIYKTIYQIKLSSSHMEACCEKKLDGDFFGAVNIVIDRQRF